MVLFVLDGIEWNSSNTLLVLKREVRLYLTGHKKPKVSERGGVSPMALTLAFCERHGASRRFFSN